MRVYAWSLLAPRTRIRAGGFVTTAVELNLLVRGSGARRSCGSEVLRNDGLKAQLVNALRNANHTTCVR